MIPLIIASGLAQAGIGMANRSSGLTGIKNAETGFAANPYKTSSSISDIYNRQLAQASGTGMDTAEGKLGQQQLQRKLTNILKYSKGKNRDISGLLGSASDDQLRLISNLSAQKRANLAALQSGAQLKTAEGMKEYKYNVLDPLNRKYALSQQQAAEGTSSINAGLRNIISGASAAKQV